MLVKMFPIEENEHAMPRLVTTLAAALLINLVLPASARGEETTPADAFSRARRLFLSGAYDQARSDLEKLAGAGSLDAGMLLTRVLMETGRAEEALRVASGLLRDNPRNGNAAVLVGEVQLQRDQLKEAEESLKNALIIDPDSRRARIFLKRIYDLTGRDDESEKVVDYFWDFNNGTLVAQKNPHADDFCYVAEAAKGYDAETTKAAFRHYGRASSRDPDLYEAYLGAGDLALEMFDWERAQRSYSEILSRNPSHPGALLGLARVYLAASENKKAEENATKALVSNPHLAGARIILAELHLIDDRTDEARQQIDLALKAKPHDRDVLAMDATWRFATGDEAGFLATVRTSLSLYPRDASIYIGVAGVLERRRRFPEALEQYRKAVALDAENWEGYFGVGMTLVRMGEESAGYKALENAFERNPFNTWAFNTLVALDRDFKDGKLAHRDTDHFAIKLSRTEVDVLGDQIDEVLEKIWAEETGRFGFSPRGPDETGRRVLFEMFAKHEDFSSRTTGMPNLGALGATLGQVVTMPSPSWGMGQNKPFNWVAVARHEFAHIITLQLTDYRIPRWFTEGISVFVEDDPQVAYDALMARAVGEDEVVTIEDLNSLFTRPDKPSDVALGYYQAALIVAYLVDEFGFGVILDACKLYRDGVETRKVFRRVTGLLPEELDKRIARHIEKHVRTVGVWAPPGPKEVARLTGILATAPGDASARARRAEGLVASMQYAEARSEALRAIQDSDGRESTAYVVLGLAQKIVDDDAASAIASFERAIEAEPKNFFAQLYLGLTYWNEGRKREAALWLEKAHETNPRFVEPVRAFRAPPFAHILLELLVELGDDERARIVAERAGGADMNDYASAKLAGSLALDAGRFQDAARWLERAISINPFDPEGQKLFAKIEQMLAAGGDLRMHLARSARAYRACTALADRDAEGFEGLARVLRALGRTEEARVTIERLREFDEAAAKELERELK
jgi:tetratricopeptide (TPR) repeat protein